MGTGFVGCPRPCHWPGDTLGQGWGCLGGKVVVWQKRVKIKKTSAVALAPGCPCCDADRGLKSHK